jgi:uncharacterized protein
LKPWLQVDIELPCALGISGSFQISSMAKSGGTMTPENSPAGSGCQAEHLHQVRNSGQEGPLLASARAYAEKHFKGARGSHAWDHTLRVFRLCERIGKAEGADMDVLRVAALLHDIGRMQQDASGGTVCHAKRGEAMARPLVVGLPLSEKQKVNVLHCIRSHRFRGDQTPGTTEARVLFDADKLDAIGAVGVARTFLFAGEVGARLHNPEANPEDTMPYSEDDTGYREFRLKLSRIRERILTGEGRRLADERHAFMEAFFSRFLQEYDGKR